MTQPAQVTCSIGAALMQPEKLSVTDVLVEVEGLLRQSKRAGKNQFVVATPEPEPA